MTAKYYETCGNKFNHYFCPAARKILRTSLVFALAKILVDVIRFSQSDMIARNNVIFNRDFKRHFNNVTINLPQ